MAEVRQEGEKKVLRIKQQLNEEQTKSKQREEEIKELKRYVHAIQWYNILAIDIEILWLKVVSVSAIVAIKIPPEFNHVYNRICVFEHGKRLNHKKLICEYADQSAK